MGYTPEVPQDLAAPACGSPASAQGTETRQGPGRELQSCGPGASQLGTLCWDMGSSATVWALSTVQAGSQQGFWKFWENPMGCGECSGVLSRSPHWTEGLPSLGTLLALSPLRGTAWADGNLVSLWETGWMEVMSPAGAATLTRIYGSQAPFPCSGQLRRAHFGWSTPWSR